VRWKNKFGQRRRRAGRWRCPTKPTPSTGDRSSSSCTHCELHPLLEEALAADDPTELEAFIDENRAALTDPYEGDPLPEDWRAALENRDVHECGDYAFDPVLRSVRRPVIHKH
jgi:hypothetical protein